MKVNTVTASFVMPVDNTMAHPISSVTVPTLCLFSTSTDKLSFWSERHLSLLEVPFAKLKTVGMGIDSVGAVVEPVANIDIE